MLGSTIPRRGAEPRPSVANQDGCAIARSYDDFPEMDGLRQALVDEQRGLCCYCTRRIEPAFNGMKVEHWKSRAEFSKLEICRTRRQLREELLVALSHTQAVRRPAARRHAH
jgi:hypothetical protein